MKILALDHVALPVKNLETSCRFYSRVLSLESIPRPDFPFPGAWYKLGSAQELHLLSRDTAEIGSVQSYDRHFALRVTCVQEAAEHLKRFEWPFRPAKQRPDGVWQIFLRDPDGYSVELFSGEPELS